jgi:hypothetical protein
MSDQAFPIVAVVYGAVVPFHVEVGKLTSDHKGLVHLISIG